MINVRRITSQYNFKTAKALGQNFLTDEFIMDAIVGGLQATKEDTVIEIGPGVGVLTGLAADQCGKLVAIELDDRLIPILHENLAGYFNVEIVHGDVLKTDLKQFAEKPVILGNLPYYITTPILMKFIEDKVLMKAAVFMVQKEVADKLTAAPGSSNYGVLAVIMQQFFNITYIVEAPPEAFMPAPKVTSQVVRLVPDEVRAASLKSGEDFIALVKKAFSQRRKTLANSMAGWKGMDKAAAAAWLSENGIDPQRRPESLSSEEFAKLSNSMFLI
ncbi:MAG: 16S rRNA (adenine(1518)-N(6)/adenine(1519)-N(6))-dimethyltransferase RsmA [Clostridia bacterium]|nr:16S rRNA (adenine(1518)-N(6)/adenine(1519)-N(6))-dimethyltransferase RsmA [Clostridia bacterium]